MAGGCFDVALFVEIDTGEKYDTRKVFNVIFTKDIFFAICRSIFFLN